jgi:hypothetical protein
MPERRFILTDGRASDGDFDAAAVFCFEDSMRAAVKSARSFGEACIFSFIEGPTQDPNHFEILDLRFERIVR